MAGHREPVPWLAALGFLLIIALPVIIAGLAILTAGRYR